MKSLRSAWRALFAAIAASLLALAGLPAFAGPSGAEGDNFIYTVEPGDTLIMLAQRYTQGPETWPTLQRLNTVADPTRLPIAKELIIPFAMIPEEPALARVNHVKGRATASGKPLQLNSEVGEGALVATGVDGFVTLVLPDQSTLTVPPASSLSIQRLRVFKGTGLTDSIVQVRAGGLESEVAPENTGVGRFEVRTPVSITGVRGTRLRVRTAEDGSQSEVVHGRAQLATTGNNRAMISQGQGAATNASGALLGVRPLLPAPALSAPARGGAGWVADFPPVAGAEGYQVQVYSDEAATQLVSSEHFAAPPITFSASGTGTFYVRVRAIDHDGVMGLDAASPFPGQPALRTAFGLPVSTAFDAPVVLRDF
jgi:hypothetical protein